MTISVTAQKGKMIAYDFQPHGTKFLKALDEILPAVIVGRQVTFNINHLSGYMVSSGRSSFASDEAF